MEVRQGFSHFRNYFNYLPLKQNEAFTDVASTGRTADSIEVHQTLASFCRASTTFVEAVSTFTEAFTCLNESSTQFREGGGIFLQAMEPSMCFHVRINEGLHVYCPSAGLHTFSYT